MEITWAFLLHATVKSVKAKHKIHKKKNQEPTPEESKQSQMDYFSILRYQIRRVQHKTRLKKDNM